MNLPMYENMRKLIQTPHDAYINQLQALVNDRWENSTQTSSIIYQQSAIGSDVYNQVDISVDTAIDIGTGFKKGDDFKVFSHKDISAVVPLGLLYRTDNDYWICINTNEFESPTNSIEVRRCNNIMKWVDPQNGYVHQEWCAIDYELSSPQPAKDKDVVVASGHIFVLVQGNENTLALKKNQRFIFNGQPYKLMAYQTLLNGDKEVTTSTLLYLDMYLDITKPSDDLVNNIANATDYVYDITIQPDVSQQVSGFNGQVSATITLNDDIVVRDVVWSGNEFVNINEDGSYELVGSAGDVATINAIIDGNPNLVATCSIAIVDVVADNFEIVIEPAFEEVRQKLPQTFSVYLYNNGVRLDDEITWGYSGLSQEYFSLVQNDHEFTLSVNQFANDPLTLTFSAEVATKTIDIWLKPLF